MSYIPLRRNSDISNQPPPPIASPKYPTMGHKHCKPGEYEQMSPDGVKYCSQNPDAHKHWPHDYDSMHATRMYTRFLDDTDVCILLIWMFLLVVMTIAIMYYLRFRWLNKVVRAVRRCIEGRSCATRAAVTHATDAKDDSESSVDKSKVQARQQKVGDVV